MTPFGEPALTTEQQVDLLIRRGMRVDDRAKALQHLRHISYDRLCAYWLPFELANHHDERHAFADGIDFSTVLAIYDFDRELRILLIDAIERVEISFRTRLAQVLSLRYGPFAHEVHGHFACMQSWQQSRDELVPTSHRR